MMITCESSLTMKTARYYHLEFECEGMCWEDLFACYDQIEAIKKGWA